MARKPKMSKRARRFIHRHTKKHLDMGMNQRQALAVSYAEAREKGYKLGPRRDRRGRFR